MATLEQLADLAVDSNQREVPTDQELSDLRWLVIKLSDAQAEVERIGRLHADAVAAERKLAFVEIPTLLAKLGVSSFGLDDGRVISLKKHYRCTIDDPYAFAWLESIGADGIIKADVTAVFDKKEIEQARALVDELVEREINVKHNQNVHPQTLKAFVRERMEADPPLPVDPSITVVVETQATVIDPATPKRRK
jgi:hypothetical protein